MYQLRCLYHRLVVIIRYLATFKIHWNSIIKLRRWSCSRPVSSPPFKFILLAPFSATVIQLQRVLAGERAYKKPPHHMLMRDTSRHHGYSSRAGHLFFSNHLYRILNKYIFSFTQSIHEKWVLAALTNQIYLNYSKRFSSLKLWIF